MYTTVRDRPGTDARARRAGPVSPRVAGNVVALGFTSLFTDISSEMVNAVLPLYLTLQLGFSPLQFGLFDGAYQGMTALVRVAGGVVADRRGRYKEVAGAGYGLSALCKLGLLASDARILTTAVLFADRAGKGVRTAPRDALISLSAHPARLGEAFGVHRALDTVGALLGPVLAFVLLGVASDAYDSVFVTSFFVALIGLAVLVCFVRNRAPERPGDRPPPSWRTAAGLVRIPRFRRLVAAAGLVGLVTVSDAFLYLVLQDRVGMPPHPFPLLFVGTALVYLLLAVPIGRLADRLGRARVFVAGHVFLAGVYTALHSPVPGGAAVALVLVLLGAYYAATDGVLMAVTSEAVPEHVRTSGFAVVTTVNVFARFVAAGLFGLLWTWKGPGTATAAFLAALLVAVPVTALLLSPRRNEREVVPA